MKIFGFLFAMLLASSTAVQANDASLLVGTWQGMTSGQVNTAQGIVTVNIGIVENYYDNGSFDMTVNSASSTGTLVVVYKGTWSFSGGLLHLVYASVEHPQYDSQGFDLLGNGQLYYPFKNANSNQVPPPADVEIRFSDADTFQGSDGIVYRRQ